MNVAWTTTALGHLGAIRQYISQTSPFYAERMIQRIMARAPQLAAFPESGRVVPEVGRLDIREVIEWPYRVIYRRESDRLVVLAIIHGRQEELGLEER